MYDILFALHLLFVIFAVGPLVHAATTAGRGIRHGDGAAISYSARMATIYSYASVLAVLVGFGLMSAKDPDTHKAVAQFSETWIWLSALLWLVAVGLTLGVIVPTLHTATATIGRQESASALTGRVAAAGGIVGLIFAAVVFLMVYKPGS